MSQFESAKFICSIFLNFSRNKLPRVLTKNINNSVVSKIEQSKQPSRCCFGEIIWESVFHSSILALLRQGVHWVMWKSVLTPVFVYILYWVNTGAKNLIWNPLLKLIYPNLLAPWKIKSVTLLHLSSDMNENLMKKHNGRITTLKGLHGLVYKLVPIRVSSRGQHYAIQCMHAFHSPGPSGLGVWPPISPDKNEKQCFFHLTTSLAPPNFGYLIICSDVPVVSSNRCKEQT
jgi:hypothetical protein